jgi:hypothetical protein
LPKGMQGIIGKVDIQTPLFQFLLYSWVIVPLGNSHSAVFQNSLNCTMADAK